MTSSRFSRRDFLKAAGAAALPLLFPRQALGLESTLRNGSQPNVLVLVLDTLSAPHMSVYGYPRPTTPALEKFAERSTVYHSHYAAGNFTTPATASMLTGCVPWTHRALNLFGLARRDLAGRNLFHQLGNDYRRIAFTQNMLAELLLRQFGADIDQHLPFPFSSRDATTLGISQRLPNDSVASFYAFDDFLATRRENDGPLAGSPLLGLLDILRKDKETVASDDFPLGAPFNNYYTYTNAETFQNILRVIEEARKGDKPYFGYFHLWTPHEPYRPRAEYLGKYKKDGYEPTVKPEHPLTETFRNEKNLLRLRQAYDEYITDVDADLGLFLGALERSGALDDTCVIITSDHGQLFERGEHGHNTALLYDGVLRIPLLISVPGQKQRADIHTPTSNIDLLPSLAALTGGRPDPASEGILLPGLGGIEDPNRSLFSLVAKNNSAFAPIKHASLSMIKGSRKLIYYLGYGAYDGKSELYDLADDPDEMNDLAAADTAAAARMKDELLSALDESNRAITHKP
jgi:arylsulfatase A-like enzyme